MHLQAFLHVYDVTNTTSPGTNTTIERLNNITRQINLGGVFHGAIELQGSHKFAGREYSFGYCERGTGVYACNSKSNPMYTYRETIELGSCEKTDDEVRQILQQLSSEWQGNTYDLLSRNCCHFCQVLSEKLGTKPVPGWLNRFAAGADATVTFTNDAITMLRQVGTEITKHASTASSWMRDTWQRHVAAQQQQQLQRSSNSPNISPRNRWGKLSSDLFNRSNDSHSFTSQGTPVVYQQPQEQRMSKAGAPGSVTGPLAEAAVGGGGDYLRAFGNSVGAVPNGGGMNSPRLGGGRQQEQPSLI